MVAKIHDAFKKATEDSEYRAVLKKLDLPWVYLSGKELKEANRQEFELIGRMVRRLGLEKK